MPPFFTLNTEFCAIDISGAASKVWRRVCPRSARLNSRANKEAVGKRADERASVSPRSQQEHGEAIHQRTSVLFQDSLVVDQFAARIETDFSTRKADVLVNGGNESGAFHKNHKRIKHAYAELRHLHQLLKSYYEE